MKPAPQTTPPAAPLTKAAPASSAVSLALAGPHIDSVLAHYKAQVQATSPTAAPIDWSGLLTKLIMSLTDLLQNFSGDAAAKKAAVEAAVLKFVQTTIEPILAAAVGHPLLVNLILGPIITKFVPQLAGAMYDAVAALLGRFGLNAAATTAPGPVGTPGGFVPY